MFVSHAVKSDPVISGLIDVEVGNFWRAQVIEWPVVTRSRFSAASYRRQVLMTSISPLTEYFASGRVSSLAIAKSVMQNVETILFS